MNRATVELDMLLLIDTANLAATVNGHELSNWDKRITVCKARAWCLKCHEDVLIDLNATRIITGNVATERCQKERVK
jgi:hypothetical protein